MLHLQSFPSISVVSSLLIASLYVQKGFIYHPDLGLVEACEQTHFLFKGENASLSTTVWSRIPKKIISVTVNARTCSRKLKFILKMLVLYIRGTFSHRKWPTLQLRYFLLPRRMQCKIFKGETGLFTLDDFGGISCRVSTSSMMRLRTEMFLKEIFKYIKYIKIK